MAIEASGESDRGDGDDEISDELLVELMEQEDQEQGKDGEDDELLCGVCDDQEEIQQPRVLRDPKKPTLRDQQEHRCTHWPYRSWCRDCNRGRGKHDQHRSKKKGKDAESKEGREVPTISIDFIFPGTEMLEARKNAQLVMYDNESDSIWAYRTGRKHNPAWLIPAMLQDLEEAGYGHCRLCVRSDQENIIKSIKKGMIDQRTGETVPQESPVKESKCNGKMEKAIQNLEGQMRTLRCAIESETGVWVHPRSRMYNYMLHWACTILTRYRVARWGKTPFQTLTGHQCSRPIAPFGTPVLWKETLKNHERDKGDTDWHQGVFLGVRWRTSEAIVSTADRVILCRTIRVDPEAEKLTEDDMNDIKTSVIELVYSKTDSENEPNDAEIQEGEDSPVMNEEDVAGLFGDFSDDEDQDSPNGVDVRVGDDHRVMFGSHQVHNSDGDIRRYGQTETRRSNGGVPSERPAVVEREDRDIREYRAHHRLRRPRPPRAPAAPTGPVVDRPDRMLSEWLRPSATLNSFEVDERTVNARNETWDTAVRIARIHNQENKEVLAKIFKGADITEVYSQPRVARACMSSGLIGGSSLDLRTGWDFTKPSHQAAAVMLVKSEAPLLLVGSPPCTKFSNLQNLNLAFRGDEWKNKFLVDREKDVEHLKFCCKLYKMQRALGRYYLHEHPDSASSWSVDCISDMLKEEGTLRVVGDQCQYGLVTTKKGVTGPAKKPTGFMTNSPMIARRLSLRCDGSHTHIHLDEGRAKAAEEYPEGLCREICRGLKDQKNEDAKNLVKPKPLSMIQLKRMLHGYGCPDHWVDGQHEDTESDVMMRKELLKLGVRQGTSWAVDDVSGAVLDPEAVRAARKVELEYFRKMGVYEKVPRWKSKGKKIIRTRWIDVNKGDEKNPDMRSRLVGKEFADSVDPSLYASTPPVEAMRLIISQAATGEGTGGQKILMTNDVRRAYFHASIDREVYVEVPPEDREEGDGDVVGRLRLCLYGTRDAAQRWQETVSSHLEGIGFRRGNAHPAVFAHPERNIMTLVHGDDYMSCGLAADLKWLQGQLAARFEIKTQMIGHDAEFKQEGKILNRVVRATPRGFEMEADQRHAELIIETLELEDNKGVATAGVDDPVEEDIDLEGEKIFGYRSLAARANYLAVDRPDIMYAAKELCRKMSRPTVQAWHKLVRLGKYLKTKPRLIWQFNWQSDPSVLTVYSDANWAGCSTTRKSTSGGAAMLGSHPIRVYSKTQSVVALSSAESEFYGTVKAATEGIGVLALMRDMNIEKKISMQVDASAALGVIERKGIGKIRHLETGALWLQEKNLRDIVRFYKTPGSENVADLFTKNVSREVCEKHVRNLGCVFEQGRAECAAQLHAISKKGEEIAQLLGPVSHKQTNDLEDDMNWSGTDMMNIDQLIEHIEGERSKKLSTMKKKWAGRIAQETVESVTGFQCNKCRCNGEQSSWQDHWHANGKDETGRTSWVRHHTRTRASLFTPCGSRGGPGDQSQLNSIRITIGTYSNGQSFSRTDDWRERSTAHEAMPMPWTGVTVFHEWDRR